MISLVARVTVTAEVGRASTMSAVLWVELNAAFPHCVHESVADSVGPTPRRTSTSSCTRCPVSASEPVGKNDGTELAGVAAEPAVASIVVTAIADSHPRTVMARLRLRL